MVSSLIISEAQITNLVAVVAGVAVVVVVFVEVQITNLVLLSWLLKPKSQIFWLLCLRLPKVTRLLWGCDHNRNTDDKKCNEKTQMLGKGWHNILLSAATSAFAHDQISSLL